MAKLARYTVKQPANSRQTRDALRTAEDSGENIILLTAIDKETDEQIETNFSLVSTRHRAMISEYLGDLSDGGTATLLVWTHSDLIEAPAVLTLVRR